MSNSLERLIYAIDDLEREIMELGGYESEHLNLLYYDYFKVYSKDKDWKKFESHIEMKIDKIKVLNRKLKNRKPTLEEANEFLHLHSTNEKHRKNVDNLLLTRKQICEFYKLRGKTFSESNMGKIIRENKKRYHVQENTGGREFTYYIGDIEMMLKMTRRLKGVKGFLRDYYDELLRISNQ